MKIPEPSDEAVRIVHRALFKTEFTEDDRMFTVCKDALTEAYELDLHTIVDAMGEEIEWLQGELKSIEGTSSENQSEN